MPLEVRHRLLVVPAGIDGKWVTLLVAPDTPKFAELGDAAVGISVPSQWAPQVAYKPDFGPNAQEFNKRFSDKYKIEAGYHAAGGYTAGLLLQHAIEESGSIDQTKVAAVLNKIDVTTLFGRTKFSTDPKEHGAQQAHAMVLGQWQKKGDRLDIAIVNSGEFPEIKTTSKLLPLA